MRSAMPVKLCSPWAPLCGGLSRAASSYRHLSSSTLGPPITASATLQLFQQHHQVVIKDRKALPQTCNRCLTQNLSLAASRRCAAAGSREGCLAEVISHTLRAFTAPAL